MSKKKAKLLFDFKPDEVSLVKKGANLKPAFIIKNKNGDIMPTEKILINKLKDFSFANEEKTMESVEAVCVEKMLNEDQKATLTTALAVVETMGKDGANGLHVSFDNDYASVSIYKADEEIQTLKSELAKVTEEKVALEKSQEETLKSHAEAVQKSANESKEKVEKLLEITKDKEAVNKIFNPEPAPEVVLPESVKKTIDEQAAIIKKYQEEKELREEEIKKAAEEKITKEFIEKAKESMPHLEKAEVLGTLLKKCNEVLESTEYETLETVLKSSNEKISKGDLFEEFGSANTEGTDDKGQEALVIKRAEEIKKSNPEVTIHKARVMARDEIRKNK